MLWTRPAPSALADVFIFSAGSKPASQLSFSPTPLRPTEPTTPRSLKRSRPLPDGGEGSCRKKRRLRLVLITSRLSRPFSSPSSHIVDRGLSKIAVWAKQKSLGRNLLRKAAIMNRIRKHAAAAVRASDQRKLEAARQAFMRQSQIVQVPRREYIPLPPSPLGLSNYDALDLEDEIPPEEHEDEDAGPTMYGDFSILGPSEPVVSDYDSLDHFDPPKILGEPPTVPGDDREVEILHEKERQKQLAFVKFEAN